MKWISVKDHLPNEDSPYLIYCPTLDESRPYINVAWFNPARKSWELIPLAFATNVTHWTPLPKPPKTK